MFGKERSSWKLKIVEDATPISDNDITNDVCQEEIVDYVDDSNISDNESSKDYLELLFVITWNYCSCQLQSFVRKERSCPLCLWRMYLW